MILKSTNRTSVCRLTKSDFREPVNIGSDEMVSMNEMAEIVLSFDNKKLPIQHIPGPEGVRGRNSDNTLIKEKLGWAPTMKLKVHLLKAAISFHLSTIKISSKLSLSCDSLAHQLLHIVFYPVCRMV